MSDQMKRLAKQRAKKDVKVEVDETDSGTFRTAFKEPSQVKRYENEREKPSGKEMDTVLEKAEGIDRKAIDRPDDLDDHASKLKRKKFRMMQSLLKDFQDLDGNGVDDRLEK